MALPPLSPAECMLSLNMHRPAWVGVIPSVVARKAVAASLECRGGVAAVLLLDPLVSPTPWRIPSGLWGGALLGGSPPHSLPIYCTVQGTPFAYIAPVAPTPRIRAAVSRSAILLPPLRYLSSPPPLPPPPPLLVSDTAPCLPSPPGGAAAPSSLVPPPAAMPEVDGPLCGCPTVPNNPPPPP